nr:hypothetical protein [Neobacillus sp. Marseille-Q6967]
MNEQKQYRDELLEWCQTVELNWESMKPRFSKLFDLESLREWEESCRQLKAKLQEDITADYEDYEIAKGIYEQMEHLYQESNSYREAMAVEMNVRSELEEEESDVLQEEVEVESNQDTLMEEPKQIQESQETDDFQEEMEAGTDQDEVTAELRQYREDLLEWCDNLYSNWIRTKPMLSNLVDNESLEGWEGLFSHLTAKLLEGPTADYEDYETANILYEQWEKLLEVSNAVQEEVEV